SIERHCAAVIELFPGCLCTHQFLCVPRFHIEMSRMETRFQVLQRVGESNRDLAVHSCHVPDLVVDRSCHLLCCGHTLSLRILQETRQVEKY
ncbi:hypothetical protein LSTR_LSTR017324, partial [Laodelphax striatellus]